MSYAPKVFRYIRAMDGISEYDIMNSIKLEQNKMQIFKTNENQSHGSGGKSGSFFFFTEDKKYIIKSMTEKEK
jgi:1-phosphatidylinositol-4-phosphate 5-kinase